MAAPAQPRQHSEGSSTEAAELAQLLPLQGEWTEDDFLWLSGRTSRVVEYTDGWIEALPMPTDRHQTILLYLYALFSAFLQPHRGKVLVAPLRLRIRPRAFREPDLLLLVDGADPRRGDAFWEGADLVLEVVSPDDPQRDYATKRRDYALAAIPEYWIVDPQAETIMVLKLESGSYVEHGNFVRGAAAVSALLAGFEVDVGAVFDAR